MKKVNIFCHSFQKVNRFITQSEIFQALLLEILMIMAYR